MAKTSSPSHWLVKQEPEKYPFSQLIKDKKTYWDGVRNYQARNNLRAMKKGEQVLFYHSVKEKAVVGVCEVIKEAYLDPTAPGEDWSVVDIKPVQSLKRPVTLAEIKSTTSLADIALIKQSRLSVMPLRKKEFDQILKMSEKPLL
ncbi:MAG: EVE domain-containing protein [Verrucomicrobiota bacterium]